MKENLCPNRYKCITETKSYISHCNWGKVIKFTYYVPKAKPLKVRGRIRTITMESISLFSVKTNKSFNGRKWFNATIPFLRKRMRITQYPIYCDGIPKRNFEFYRLCPENKRV